MKDDSPRSTSNPYSPSVVSVCSVVNSEDDAKEMH